MGTNSLPPRLPPDFICPGAERHGIPHLARLQPVQNLRKNSTDSGDRPACLFPILPGPIAAAMA